MRVGQAVRTEGGGHRRGQSARPAQRCRFWLAVATAGIVAALGLGSSRTAEAQAAVGPHGGYDLIIDEFQVGVQGRIPFAQIGQNAQAVFYPNIDFFPFGDDLIIGFDADLIFPFRVERYPISPYAGLGFGITYQKGDFTEDTAFDMNLLTGTSILTGTVAEPFVEVEASLFGTDRVALIVGLNILIGYHPGRSGQAAQEPAPPADPGE